MSVALLASSRVGLPTLPVLPTVPLLAFVAGLVLARCAATHPRVWYALTPRTAVRQVALYLLAAVLLTYTGLFLLAAPVLLSVLPESRLSAACREVLAGTGPGLLCAFVAITVLAGSTAATVARARRFRRERGELRVEHDIGDHEPGPGFDLVTVPSEVPLAYSLGGTQPQVVVSQGLLSRLDEREVAAVVAHEAAHLRARHDRWLALAGLVETALWFAPWARSGAATMRVLLERWADEDASHTVGRGALRSALLAAIDLAPLPPQTAALSRAGMVVERLEALRDDDPRAGAPPLLCAALLAVATVTAMGGLSAALATLAHLCVR